MNTHELDVYIKIECGLSENTYTAYLNDINEFLRFNLDDFIDAGRIEKFISHLKQKGCTSSTIKRKLMAIRCLCNHLISLDLLDKSVIDNCPSIKVQRETKNVVNDSCVDEIVSYLCNSSTKYRTKNIRRNVAIILILYDSGLRSEELCLLNCEDFRSDDRDLRVTGKGSRQRIVPISQRCKRAIESYLSTRDYTRSDPLFVDKSGKRIRRRNVSDMILSASQSAGVESVTAHTLRRSCATNLLDKGVDLDLVKELMGHTDISTTQLYLHVDDEKLKMTHSRCHPFGITRRDKLACNSK